MMNQDMNPIISVVIPLYNKAAHILDAIESIEAQTLPAFEIVIVDDGSTDNGADLVLQQANKKVRLFKQANAGVSAARNKGINESNGDFIAFLDADDVWLPHFLEEMGHLIQSQKTASVYASSYQMRYNFTRYENPKINFKKPMAEAGLLKNYFEVGASGALPFFMSSVVFSKQLIQQIGGFPEGEPMGEDQDLFCRAALNCDIAYSPKVLAIYEMDSENRACKRNIPAEECPFSRRLKQINPSQVPIQTYNHIMDYTAAHILHLAKLNVEAGNLSAAKGLLEDPRCARKPLKRFVNQTRYAIKKFAAQFIFKMQFE